MPIPRATARLQFHQHFDFDAAVACVDYYASLGISHLYASPIFAAQPGSTHGYDVVDPTRVNPELGGEEGLRRLADRLRERGMGLILDIVPNHMGIAGANNPWWQDVLEWGQESAHSTWFDIDWQREDDAVHGKVLLPFLGQQYGTVLQSGDLALRFDPVAGKIFVGYHDNRFPIGIRAYSTILRKAALPLLESVIAAFDTAPSSSPPACAPIFEMLAEIASSPEGLAAVTAALACYDADGAAGFEPLHALLEEQHYRLAWWRYAADGLNWRRFFEVTDLAGMRVENVDVFDATHALTLRLYEEGIIDGVRVDHVDGLADPTAYCLRLRQALAERAPHRPDGDQSPAYIVVEKILAASEQLRADWQVDGTTGYDFMDQVGAFLHAPQGEAIMDLAWVDVRPEACTFEQEVHAARRQLLVHNLAAERDAACRALLALARCDLATRDYSLNAIRRVFTELLVQFPVYRTYVSGGTRSVDDETVFQLAMTRARERVGLADLDLLAQLDAWLGGAPAANAAGGGDNAAQRARLGARAIRRFQQLTPPLVAKSVEDTAFYRYGRLLSRNQVGSDPGQFALSARDFDAACAMRATHFPHAMLATATHDHKRGEDVTARLAVLSEVPRQWREHLQRWRAMNAAKRVHLPAREGQGGAATAPDPADEAVLYQTLIGVWPIGLQANDAEGIAALRDRVAAWQQKALREAKTNTSWVEPDTSYEQACSDFLAAILAPEAAPGFIAQLTAWVEELTCAGIVNSLTQTVLRLTVPGVPDLYQGADLWDFSLVDPDNRRPVDFDQRIGTLARHADQAIADVSWQDGAIKQRIIRDALQFRREQPALFAKGSYIPLEIVGPEAGSLFAFLRMHEGAWALVIVARLVAHLSLGRPSPSIDAAVWQGTSIRLPDDAPGAWHNVFGVSQVQANDGCIAIGSALAGSTVAILRGGRHAG
jgi:(1->4)-alpha-D-glucan 1-alpha-D-glucosylmutase